MKDRIEKLEPISTGNKVIDHLYKAVIKYVESNGGSVAVIGGVAIVQEGARYNYGVMVRVTGAKPVFDHLNSLEGK